jgi:hypothetical protein
MKNTFLQSPVIVLQHIKNSAWAIEKPYSKTCVSKGFLHVIYTTFTGVTQAQFLPVSPPLNLDEIQGSKKHPGTWFHPTRLHRGEHQSFQLHIGRKKKWGK